MVKAGAYDYFYNLPPGLNIIIIFKIFSPVVKNRNIFCLYFTYRDPISFRAFSAKISQNEIIFKKCFRTPYGLK